MIKEFLVYFSTIVIIPTIFLAILKIIGIFPAPWIWVFLPFYLLIFAVIVAMGSAIIMGTIDKKNDED